MILHSFHIFSPFGSPVHLTRPCFGNMCNSTFALKALFDKASVHPDYIYIYNIHLQVFAYRDFLQPNRSFYGAFLIIIDIIMCSFSSTELLLNYTKAEKSFLNHMRCREALLLLLLLLT